MELKKKKSTGEERALNLSLASVIFFHALPIFSITTVSLET